MCAEAWALAKCLGTEKQSSLPNKGCCSVSVSSSIFAAIFIIFDKRLQIVR